VPAEKRGLALGAWSGISGLAVALGPVVGGAVVTGISWHWIFWLNVPIGAVAAPLAMVRLSESHGESRDLDFAGLGLASAGLLGLVYGIVHAASAGWTAFTVLGPIAAGAALLATFVAWELRAPEPMLPMSFFRSRAVTGPTVAYIHFVPGFVMAGTGMALVFAPAANTVLGSVRPKQAGQASGATNAMRELGGVLGVSVLATVFSGSGGYLSAQNYVDGLVPAISVGSAVMFAGALIDLLISGKRREGVEG